MSNSLNSAGIISLINVVVFIVFYIFDVITEKKEIKLNELSKKLLQTFGYSFAISFIVAVITAFLPCFAYALNASIILMAVKRRKHVLIHFRKLYAFN